MALTTSSSIFIVLALVCQITSREIESGADNGIRMTWFVSNAGQDTKDCGSNQEPCQTIPWVVKCAKYNSSVFLEGGNKKEYLNCSSILSEAITINKSLHFHSYNGRASIGCKDHKEKLLVLSGQVPYFVPEVSFNNIYINEGIIAMENITLTVVNCTMENIKIVHAVPTHLIIDIRISNTLIVIRKDIFLILHSTFMHLDISDCQIATAYRNYTGIFKTITLYVTDYITVNIQNVTISPSGKHGDFGIFVKNNKAGGAISLYNVTIKNIQTSFSFKNGNLKETPVPQKEVFVHVDGLKIQNATGFGLLFYGKSVIISIKNSIFSNSVLQGSLISYEGYDKITITNSTFENISMCPQCDSDASQNVLKGAILSVNMGHLWLENCLLKGNVGQDNTGVIFISADANALISGCYFEYNSVTHSISGDIIQSKGTIIVVNTTFNALTASSLTPLLAQDGQTVSKFIEISPTVLCPVGFMVRQYKTRASISSPDIIQYYVLCKQCGHNQYSLDQGKIIENKTGDFTCHECPYGGICEGTITANDNYWGEKSNNEITFTQCPPGYCCNNCSSYNECAGNRTGTLCGKCKPGYSEALFSNKCIHDDSCHNTWFWPLVMVYGIVYVLVLLLYFSDISNIIYKILLDNKKSDEGTAQELTSLLANHNAKEFPKIYAKKFIKATFHYFQVASILHVSVIEKKATRQLQFPTFIYLSKFIVKFFNFGLVQLTQHICPFPGLNSLLKHFFKLGFVIYIFLLLLFIWLCYKFLVCLVRKCKKQRKTLNTGGDHVTSLAPRDINNENERQISGENTDFMTQDQTQMVDQYQDFNTRVLCGIMLALILTYQTLSKITFSLLNCVTLSANSNSVLFIYGDTKCYTEWQYLLIFFCIFWLCPFSAFLVVGTKLLKCGKISLLKFSISCIFPVPCLIYSFYLWMSQKIDRIQTTVNGQHNVSNRTCHVLVTLGASPEQSTTDYWIGLPVGARLLIVLIDTFVSHSILKVSCMLLVCFIVALLHNHTKSCRENNQWNVLYTYERATYWLLTGIALANLIKATMKSSQISFKTSDPNVLTVHVLVWLEAILVDWVFLIAASILVLLVVLRLMYKLALLVQRKYREHKAKNN